MQLPVLETTQLVLTVLSGLVVGVIITIPAGPVNIVCIQRTLERGFWAGFAAGIGAVLGDGLIATVAVSGLTAISGLMNDYAREVQFVGGGMMVAFGIKLFTAKPKLTFKKRRTTWAELRRLVDWVPERLRPALRFQIWRILPHTRIIPQTFFITITNPAGVLAILGIMTWVVSLIGGISNYIQALALVLSLMAGSLVWWAVIARLIERLRDRITEDRIRRINQVAGIVLLAFGGVLFAKLAIGLTGHAADTTIPFSLPGVSHRVDLLGYTV